MINDFNENISDFVTELVVWSQPLSRQQSISQNSFLSLFQFLLQWRIKLCLNLEMLITDLLIPSILWQTVVGIVIMVLEQVPAVIWMGNWFTLNVEWLKLIGQLVDWSVSNTKPFIPWDTHMNSNLHFWMLLVIKCLFNNFNLAVANILYDSWWPFSLHASLKVRHWFFYFSAMIIEIRKNRSQICHFTLYFETLTQRLVACSSLWLWCYLCLTNSDTDVTLCIAGPGISVSGEWWTRTEAAQRGSPQGSVNRTGHSL